MAPRPATEKDMWLKTNGSPLYLGSLVSTGAAVNNATTATKFRWEPLGPVDSVASPQNLANTLAGKLLLLQTSAAGLILPSTSPAMVATAAAPLIALQSVVPPLTNTAPGVALTSGERVIVLMQTNEGWLQWLPVSGSANLLVWELR